MARNFLTETNSRESVAGFHAIVTDHPRMKALGLGVFTTGDLNAWLQNLKAGYPPDADPPEKEFYSNWTTLNYSSIDTILGHPLKDTDDWGSFKAWRRDGATGRYETKNIKAWDYSYLGLDGSFDQSDLLLGDYWDISQPNGMIFTHINPLGYEIKDHWSSHGQKPVSMGRNFFENSDSSILQVIEMNNWMNQFKRYYPRTEWTNSPDAKLTSAKLFAMEAFLTDIKASKYGYLEFSGVIPFNINLADGGIQCIKKDIVKYKLYLYDDSKVRNTEKMAVLKDPKFAGYKKDNLGRVYSSTNDGELVEADTTNPSQQSVGELDRRWNPYTMKWESGSTNMFAKVVTRIGTSVNNPTVESLIDSDIKVDLDGDPDRHFAPSSGLCMPIEIQNANPMQWQPNYARTSGCREEARDKATVVGYNFNPLKSYSKDTLVMLTQMGGIWHITDMGSGIDPDDNQPVEAIFEGKWEFQYMGTNANNYFTGFTNKDTPKGTILTRIDPDYVEKAMHVDYYFDDSLNGGNVLNDQGEYTSNPWGDYYDGEDLKFTTRGVHPFYGQNGWWQFTSFDFMDAKIGGTHEANYLATTNPLVDSANRPTPIGPGAAGQAAHTGGFFGCIFPDGYSLNTTNAFFGERDFVMLSADNRQLDPDLAVMADAGFFNTELISEDLTVAPFLDPAPTYARDEEGKMTGPYIPERSKARCQIGGFQFFDIDDPAGGGPETGDPEAPLVDSEYEDELIRTSHFSAHYAPSMFYQETEKNQRNLKQLPADIATLSSPSGKNGCPIQNIHAYQIFHSDMKGIDLRNNMPLIFQERYWLRRSLPLVPPISKADRQYDAYDSAFGFQPSVKNKIMFKPLKVGTWTQYLKDIHYYAGGRNDTPYIGAQMGGENGGLRPRDRRMWSADVTRHFHDNSEGGMGPIASPKSKSRNLAGLLNEGLMSPWRHHGSDLRYVSAMNSLYDYGGPRGLLLRGDIETGSTRAREEKRFFHSQGYGGRVHDRDWWNYEHFNGGDNRGGQASQILPETFKDGLGTKEERGANVFGVIGAVATAAANTTITFSTNNAFGMMCESKRSTGSSFLRASWGGSDVNNIYSNRTTALFATVYHAHPREDTIYDARYFAVHHFNPHILDSGKPAVAGFFNNSPILRVPVPFLQRDDDDNIVTIYNNVMSRSIILDTDGFPYKNSDGDYSIGSQRKLNHEVLVPTRHSFALGDAVSCSVGERIFKDKVLGTDHGLMHEKYWNFTSNRLGKLLPYRYSSLKMGAPWISGVTVSIAGDNAFTALSSALPEDGVLASTLANKMVIKSSGQNYKKGDIVGNVNLKIGISVDEVKNVTLPDGTEVVGAVSKLKLFSAGKVSQTHLANTIVSITPKKSAGYNIRNVAAQGTGFDGYFVNAGIYQDLPIDHKPGIVDTNGRSFQLSSNADSQNGESVTNTRSSPNISIIGMFIGSAFGGGGTFNSVGGDFGIVYTPRETAVLIPPEKRSPNRKYDIFFHFHNDISHTFNDANYGDTQNPDDLHDQYIETTISAI